MRYRVFYTCYETDDVVESNNPLVTDRENMISIAQQVLRGDGDYFGIIDENDVTLQLMVVGSDRLRIEVPEPSERGSYARTITLTDLESELLAISPLFDRTKMTGLVFEPW